MNSAIERQLLSGFKAREKQDGTAFVYGDIPGIGILGVPSLEAQFAQGGVTERLNATLTIRRSWFKSAPVSGQSVSIFPLSSLQLSTAVLTGRIPPALLKCAPARIYLVTGINPDDPLVYEFHLLDR